MSLTPAQEYRQRKMAELKARQDADVYGSHADKEYTALLANLAEQKRALKSIQSNEAKGLYKAKALEDFNGWIDGVLRYGQGQKDPIFSEMLIWNIDAGNYDRALEMAEYALKHNLDAPDHFNRKLPVALMDEFCNAAKAKKLGTRADELLATVISMTSVKDAPDELRAKLFKMHAFALIGRIEGGDIDEQLLTLESARTALNELNRAFKLDTDVGVVKEQRKLESFIKKEEEKNSANAGENSGTGDAANASGKSQEDELPAKNAQETNEAPSASQADGQGVPPAPQEAQAEGKSQAARKTVQKAKTR